MQALDADSSSEFDTTKKMSRVRKVQKNKKEKNVGTLSKKKEKILVEVDALVQKVSDDEVDLGFVGHFAEGVDPEDDSWPSEEMKTPLNSEDELEDNDSDYGCPVFMEGERFGELHLEVGMKFGTKDHEDTCWQIKTFNDDHTYLRKDRNRTTNRNWLVKKIKKYRNFRYCETTTYFRTRFNLTLNKNSISRTLINARSVVYGDEKESHKMVRD
ncbi:hypothetical protein Ahy_B05g078284 [Arachis hypogaea]|uniref:Uncharacterized protein n=1 Tax=Arachis hypogaea TaxID=3818 RepID=A0A444Z6Q0_ARAHY|nr:hypothetical protein Ahy_B05g078284 [Arachis hypogaea]